MWQRLLLYAVYRIAIAEFNRHFSPKNPVVADRLSEFSTPDLVTAVYDIIQGVIPSNLEAPRGNLASPDAKVLPTSIKWN